MLFTSGSSARGFGVPGFAIAPRRPQRETGHAGVSGAASSAAADRRLTLSSCNATRRTWTYRDAIA